MTLSIKPQEGCAFDMIALGEVMLRLDPGDTRIKTAREFRAWEGGGEYNVARGLRRCFGLRTAAVTAWNDTVSGGTPSVGAAWMRASGRSASPAA